MSDKRPVLEAARVGHRITHEDDLPEPREILVAVVETLATHLRPRQNGAVSALLAQGLTRVRRAISKSDDEEHECPDPCGEIERGSPNTFVGRDRRSAAIVDDDIDIECDRDDDGPIVEGAQHVWVNKGRWARRTDELDCGARVGEGEPTVLLGADRGSRRKREDRAENLEGVLLSRVLASSRDLASWAALVGARRSRG